MRRFLLLLATGSILGIHADAQGFETIRIATGLSRPVFVTAPPGDAGRLFVVEQHTGQIRILRRPRGPSTRRPSSRVPGVSQGNEQGLLGLAFHPDYATNGFFYVNYTDPEHADRPLPGVGRSRRRRSRQRDAGPRASSSPRRNHNGGWLGFGPDGYLYIATGDGGGGNDSDTGHTAGTGNAQDITDNLLGKILRIDVDGDDFPADPQRNYAIPAGQPLRRRRRATTRSGSTACAIPWRVSFDRQTGDLYIGDVGQDRCEELDVQPGTSARRRELRLAPARGRDRDTDGRRRRTGARRRDRADLRLPARDHGRAVLGPAGTGFTGIAITGGYVYRGPVAALDGRYFFADYGTGRLWSLRWDGSPPEQLRRHQLHRADRPHGRAGSSPPTSAASARCRRSARTTRATSTWST